MKKFILVTVVYVIFLFDLNAQIVDASFDPKAESIRMVSAPNSPEAQAFTKYGNTEVNMYLGVPNIQIPIYMYKGRELDLPITLTYDASGIKVEQMATNVGLGWNLNLGGRISRITNGLPDDYYQGAYTNTPYKTIFDKEVRESINLYKNVSGNSPTFESQNSAISYLRFLKKVNDNEYDTQPDYFSFSALGNNDMFTIDINNLKAVPLNNPRNKVSIEHIPTSNNPISSWKVTTNDGTSYFFEKSEITRDRFLGNTPTTASNSSQYGMKKEYNSSWLLTKIISKTGKDIYEFEYVDLGFWTNNKPAAIYQGVTNALGGCQNNAPSPTIPMGYTGTHEYKIKQFVVKEIFHNSKKIVSIALKERYDLEIKNAISQIHFFDGITSSMPVQSFNFKYDYFKTAQVSDPKTAIDTHIRLKLDAIEYLDKKSNNVKSYNFHYENPNNLSSLTSKAQDYYGYYNGADYNTVLYPKAPNENCMPSNGADRTPSFDHTIKGLLTKIEYPTGGYTEFEFEPNKEQVRTQNSGWTTIASVSVSNGDDIPSFDSTVCNSNNVNRGEKVTPRVNSDFFEVAKDNTPHNLSAIFEGNLGKAYNVNHIVSLIKLPNDSKQYSWSDIFDENCNIKQDVEVVWSSNLVWDGTRTPIGVNKSITLDKGHFQVVVANPFKNVNTTLSVTANASIVVNEYIEKAGIRLKKITNYKSTSQIALQKSYEYPSGTVISNPRYSYRTEQYSLGIYSNIIQTTILHRLSSVSGTDKPHIGYSKVLESIEDYINSNNSIKSIHQFNTIHYGNYRTGVYTYYINGKETSKQYGVNYSLGKPSYLTQFNSSNKKVLQSLSTYLSNDFYTNTGIYVHVDESKSELYPIPTQLLNGKWSFQYVPGEKIPSFKSPHEHIGGDGRIRVKPPRSCNISNFITHSNINDLCKPAVGRLIKNNTYAFGRIGNISQKIEKQYFNDNETLQNTSYHYYNSNDKNEPKNYQLKETKNS